MSEKKTILLPLLFGLTLRNYLRTDFLSEVTAAGHRIVGLLPDTEIDGLKEEFEPLGVTFEQYPRYTPTFMQKRLRDLRDVQFYKKHPMKALDKKILEMKQNSYPRYFFNYVLAKPFIPAKQESVLDDWYFNSQKTDTIDALWERIQPDLFISTNSFFWEELPLLKKAKQTNTKVLGLIHSWDNLTTKFKLPYRFDTTCVWNDVMYDELKRYYPGYEKDGSVIGVPQFDYYHDIEKLGQSREEFLEGSGLDPKYPLITYTANPDVLSSTGHFDVEILLKAIQDGYFGGPVNVLVRFHMRGNMDRYDHLKSYPNLVMEKPGRMNPLMKDLFNPTRQDMIRFADTLRHSNCTINTFSTVTVDACFFDTPVVSVAGDFSPGSARQEHMERLYDWEHYKPILETGASILVHNKEDYLATIKKYLEQPEYRREERAKLFSILAGPSDGQAAKRLAQNAMELL